jgi:Tfp pilus assembly protein PilF
MIRHNLIIWTALVLTATQIYAAGSSTYKPSRSNEVMQYNRGVELMMDKEFEDAEKYFRKALDQRESFAEAHNNLAYVLRKQGSKHFDEALAHYNRAVELKPGIAEPYMYRGVLYVQMGDKQSARKDLAQLNDMRSVLAKELAYVIEHGKEKVPEQFFGVSGKLNK